MISPSTKRTYGRYLDYLGKWTREKGIGLSKMTIEQFEDFCTFKKYKRTTSKAVLSAVKDKLNGHDYPLKDYTIRPKDARPTRPLTRKQFHRLMGSFGSGPKDKRDKAIVGLMVDGAPRVSEVSLMDLEDLNLEDRFIDFYIPKTDGWHRTVYGYKTRQDLTEYLTARNSSDPALFVSTITGKRLTTDGLKVTIRRLGERIGIKLSPHMLRATAACAHTLLGLPTRMVQLLGNWSSVELVERYTSFLKADDIEKFPNDEW